MDCKITDSEITGFKTIEVAVPNELVDLLCQYCGNKQQYYTPAIVFALANLLMTEDEAESIMDVVLPSTTLRVVKIDENSNGRTAVR